MRLRKLQWFTIAVLTLALLSGLLSLVRVMETDRSALTYFFLALVLICAGFELVRSELSELRSMITKDGTNTETARGIEGNAINRTV